MTQRETCRHGHPLTAENVYVHPRTGRETCRKCAYVAVKRHNLRKRGIEPPRTCECGRKLNGKKRTCAPCRSQRSNSYHITDADRAWTYKRDGHQCLVCESTENLSVDHVLPRALGGPDHRSNYQTLCAPCNASKGATYADYRATPSGQLSLVLTMPKKTLRDRFMEKADRQANGCWHWTGARMTTGNAAISVDGATVMVTRVAYELFHGAVPEGKWVYRSCQNSDCVAPDHLEVRDPGYGYSGASKPQNACQKGHPYTEDNIRWDGKRRRCRTCRNEASRRYAHKKQALAS